MLRCRTLIVERLRPAIVSAVRRRDWYAHSRLQAFPGNRALLRFQSLRSRHEYSGKPSPHVGKAP